jgi:transketolase
MRQTCLNMVRELAKHDPRVVFIGSDLSPALCKSETPERWFMEGVAEQNLIGMAAGMAMDGLVPYCNTIATFITRRCYDQVAVDLCMHNLPVRLIGNGGGMVYSPLGPTHLAIEDIAIMRALPNMTVVAPCDADEMKAVMEASLDWPHPMYIRLARGGEDVVSDKAQSRFNMERARLMTPTVRPPVAFMSTGVMTQNCLNAAAGLAAHDIECAVVHFPVIKPLDWHAAVAWAGTRLTVTVEEGIRSGGFGTAVREAITAVRQDEVMSLGIDDRFPESYGTREDLWEQFGLMPAQIVRSVLERLKSIASSRDVGQFPLPLSPSPVLTRDL